MDRSNGGLFGGGSPAHDKLVLMAIEKRGDIIRWLLPEILRPLQKSNVIDVFLCPRGEAPPWCKSDFQTAFRTDPVCLRATESNPYSLVYSSNGELRLPRVHRLCPETYWARQDYTPEDICARLNEICEPVELEEGFFFFNWGEICVKSTLDGEYIHSILPYYDHMILPSTDVLESYEVDWETKKICKRDTGFFLGCADVVFDYKLTIQNAHIISDIETWRGPSKELNLRLVTKVNPKLTNWGITHGKLKVFMDNLRKRHSPNVLPIAGIIPTFSRASLEVHKILEKDNIFIIRFTQKGEISDGVSPGQTRL